MSSSTKMQKTIYVHAGMSKTGTTSIQKMLSNSEQLLNKHRILFATSARKNGIGHHSLAAFLKQGKDSDEANKLQSEINNSDHDIVIVSSELLERMSVQQWQSLKVFFAPHHVKIIYYLRRQDDAIVSMYNELVKKHAMDLSFNNYLAHSPRVDLLDYRKTLGTIEKVFGIENISVGIFSAGTLMEGNIGNDFIARVNPDLAGLEEFSAPHDNFSLMPATAMLMARINRQVDFDVDHSKYYGPACKLAEVVNTTVMGTTTIRHDYFESPFQRELFLQKFAESNQFISDKYLQGQAFFQDSSTAQSNLLAELDELTLLNGVLSQLIKRYCKESDKRDGLAKIIGLLWQDELQRMLNKE